VRFFQVQAHGCVHRGAVGLVSGERQHVVGAKTLGKQTAVKQPAALRDPVSLSRETVVQTIHQNHVGRGLGRHPLLADRAVTENRHRFPVWNRDRIPVNLHRSRIGILQVAFLQDGVVNIVQVPLDILKAAQGKHRQYRSHVVPGPCAGVLGHRTRRALCRRLKLQRHLHAVDEVVHHRVRSPHVRQRRLPRLVLRRGFVKEFHGVERGQWSGLVQRAGAMRKNQVLFLARCHDADRNDQLLRIHHTGTVHKTRYQFPGLALLDHHAVGWRNDGSPGPNHQIQIRRIRITAIPDDDVTNHATAQILAAQCR